MLALLQHQSQRRAKHSADTIITLLEDSQKELHLGAAPRIEKGGHIYLCSFLSPPISFSTYFSPFAKAHQELITLHVQFA